MNKKSTEELKKFISFTGNIKNPRDLSLIILERGAVAPSIQTWKKINKDLMYFGIKNNVTEYLLTEKILEAQKNRKRLLLDIKKDLSSASINFLKKIVEFGIIDMDGKSMDFVPGTVITLIDRDFAQKNISYDNFYNLFSSAFSIKKLQ